MLTADDDDFFDLSSVDVGANEVPPARVEGVAAAAVTLPAEGSAAGAGEVAPPGSRRKRKRGAADSKEPARKRRKASRPRPQEPPQLQDAVSLPLKEEGGLERLPDKTRRSEKRRRRRERLVRLVQFAASWHPSWKAAQSPQVSGAMLPSAGTRTLLGRRRKLRAGAARCGGAEKGRRRASSGGRRLSRQVRS